LLSQSTSSDADTSDYEALFGFVAEFSRPVEACGFFHASHRMLLSPFDQALAHELFHEGFFWLGPFFSYVLVSHFFLFSMLSLVCGSVSGLALQSVNRSIVSCMAENKPFQNYCSCSGGLLTTFEGVFIFFWGRLAFCLKFRLRAVFASFLSIGAYSVWFVVYDRFIFGFVFGSHEPRALANFKYKLEIIINSEVNIVAKAAKKKKKGGKK
jgi:hypothetical protein